MHMSQTLIAVPLSLSLSVHLSPLLSSCTTPHTPPPSSSSSLSSVTHLIFNSLFSPVFVLLGMKKSVRSKPGDCSSLLVLQMVCLFINLSTPPVSLSYLTVCLSLYLGALNFKPLCSKYIPNQFTCTTCFVWYWGPIYEAYPWAKRNRAFSKCISPCVITSIMF